MTTPTQAQIEADNQRLRSALADMVEITKRNSSPSIILTAIRTCAAHALTAATEAGEPPTAEIEAAEHILDNAIAYATGTKVTISIKQANLIWSALVSAAAEVTMLTKDSKKFEADRAAAEVDDEVSYSENDVKIIIAANIERCAQACLCIECAEAIRKLVHYPMGAAEVGAQQQYPEWSQAGMWVYPNKLDNATIERCAQVAEQMQKRDYGYQEPSPIAAAIRKLKDEV